MAQVPVGAKKSNLLHISSQRKRRMNYKQLVQGLVIAGLMSSAAAEIKVGVIGPFSKGSAPIGESMRQGIRLAVSEINAQGGVALNGKKETITLVERDDEASNEKGPLFSRELIDKEKVVAALSFVNTGVAKPSLPIFQQAKIPVIIPASAGSVLTHLFDKEPENYVFRVSAYDKLQSGMIVEAAIRKGYKKVALLTDTSAYGQLGREDVLAALKTHGITPVADEKFNVGDKDMTAQLLKIQKEGAEVLLTYGIGPELAVIAKNRVKVGYTAPMIGAWGLGMSNFVDGAGSAGNGALTPQSFIQEAAVGKQKEFVAKYQKQSGQQRMSCAPAAAQGYDATYILKAAIEQANSTEGTKILHALEHLAKPVSGVITTYVKPFAKNDHEALNLNNVKMGEIKDGKIIVAK
jgi:branched-chain amino acid transport system substrate-binding protein